MVIRAGRKLPVIVGVGLCVLSAVILLASDATLSPPSTQSRLLRTAIEKARELSINLGNGACIWTPADPLPADQNVPRTLLVSYPGSGKRYIWRMIEGVTGYRVGDDWDHTDLGKHVATLKTSYPHQESFDWPAGKFGDSAWGPWVDDFGDAVVIYVVRNPRNAIPSYHNMVHELVYPLTWKNANDRRHFAYSTQATYPEWAMWKDMPRLDEPHPNYPGDTRPRANIEIAEWSKHIDYWMTGGASDPERPLCNGAIQADCKPTVLLSFEKLYDTDEEVSEAEFARMWDVMDRPGLPLMDEEARVCVTRETKSKQKSDNHWDDRSRDGKGTDTNLKDYTNNQLNLMISEIQRLIGKYSVGQWTTDANAIYLVELLNGYLTDIQQELAAQSA